MSADDATIARPGTPDPVRRGARHGLSGPTVMSESELQDAAVSLQGHYSGPVTRLLAFALDQGVVNEMFGLPLSLLDAATRAIDGPPSSLKVPPLVATIGYIVWWLVYFAYPWAVSGRTLGMAFVGIRVVATDGSELSPGRSILRAAILPLGFVTLGLGYIWALVDRRRRALHDMLAGSAVVYDWDARAARLRFLARGPAGHEAGKAVSTPS